MPTLRMAIVPLPTQSAVLAVLQEAKISGTPRLTRTALVKLVYLLDCLHAEAHAGATASGADWRFHHFGPYAGDLNEALDQLSARGLVQSVEGESGDKDYTLFWLGEFPVGPSLAAVGLPTNLATRFSQLVRRFSGDLSKLLDYTYFKTYPMMDATPGERLDFGTVPASVVPKPHRHTHVVDQQKIFRMLQLADQIKANYQEQQSSGNALAAHRPIYDGEFHRAMDAADVKAGEFTPISFDAQLA